MFKISQNRLDEEFMTTFPATVHHIGTEKQLQLGCIGWNATLALVRRKATLCLCHNCPSFPSINRLTKEVLCGWTLFFSFVKSQQPIDIPVEAVSHRDEPMSHICCILFFPPMAKLSWISLKKEVLLCANA